MNIFNRAKLLSASSLLLNKHCDGDSHGHGHDGSYANSGGIGGDNKNKETNMPPPKIVPNTTTTKSSMSRILDKQKFICEWISKFASNQVMRPIMNSKPQNRLCLLRLFGNSSSDMPAHEWIENPTILLKNHFLYPTIMAEWNYRLAHQDTTTQLVLLDIFTIQEFIKHDLELTISDDTHSTNNAARQQPLFFNYRPPLGESSDVWDSNKIIQDLTNRFGLLAHHLSLPPIKLFASPTVNTAAPAENVSEFKISTFK